MFTLYHVGRAHRRAPQPKEIAAGVYCLEVGTGIMRSNVYFVRSGSSWVLIDTGSAKCDREIQKAAESLFGAKTRPAAILLTQDHPDHAHSAPELALRWGCLVSMHPDELPLVTMDASTYLSTVTRRYTQQTAVIGAIIGGEGVMALWVPLIAGAWSDTLRSRIGGRPL